MVLSYGSFFTEWEYGDIAVILHFPDFSNETIIICSVAPGRNQGQSSYWSGLVGINVTSVILCCFSDTYNINTSLIVSRVNSKSAENS